MNWIRRKNYGCHGHWNRWSSILIWHPQDLQSIGSVPPCFCILAPHCKFLVENLWIQCSFFFAHFLYTGQKISQSMLSNSFVVQPNLSTYCWWRGGKRRRSWRKYGIFSVMVPLSKLSWIFIEGSRGTCGFGGRLFKPVIASSSAWILSCTGIGRTILGLSSWWLSIQSIVGCWGDTNSTLLYVFLGYCIYYIMYNCNVLQLLWLKMFQIQSVAFQNPCSIQHQTSQQSSQAKRQAGTSKRCQQKKK